MAVSMRRCAVSAVGDLSVVISIGVTSILIRQLATPYQRGFFKDDDSLRYPQKPSTVHHNVLYGVGFSLPTVTVLLVEGIWIWVVQKQAKTKHSNFSVWLWNIYRVCLMFYYGVAVTHFSTNVSKYTIGRLRPHFFAVCQPDTSALNSQTYLQGDLCQGNDTDSIKEARVSFPSGHSSMAAYCMLFLAIYLQKRFVWQGMLLLKSFLQMVCLGMAFFTCLSRVSDYKHHWSDVLAGGILGMLVTVFVYWSIGASCMPLQPKRSSSVDHGVPDQEVDGSFRSADTNAPLGTTAF